MTSIACPKCGKHITEYDVICLNCNFVITPEIRAKLLKEREERILLEADLARRRVPNRHKEHKLQRKLNRITLRLFGIGWAKLVVPFIIFILLLIVFLLMILYN